MAESHDHHGGTNFSNDCRRRQYGHGQLLAIFQAQSFGRHLLHEYRKQRGGSGHVRKLPTSLCTILLWSLLYSTTEKASGGQRKETGLTRYLVSKKEIAH